MTNEKCGCDDSPAGCCYFEPCCDLAKKLRRIKQRKCAWRLHEQHGRERAEAEGRLRQE